MISISFQGNTVKLAGEIDIFCAEQFKNAIREQDYKQYFVLDMQSVSYIDSSGIGALITLHNHYQQRGVAFRIQPSESIGKIFAVSKLDKLFLEDAGEEGRAGKVIAFYDSFEADTKILSYLIDRLFEDLAKAGYSAEESQEIVVAVDEAITNAILETIKATGDVDDDLTIVFDSKSVKSIAVRWEIHPEDFFATVIDHGAGFDLNTIQERIPQVEKADYLGQVDRYQEKCNLHLRLNGKEIELKRLGAGLKIMASFMDAIYIDLIDAKDALSSRVGRGTLGTILNLYRRRRMRDGA